MQKKCTAKVNTENPEPEPDPKKIENAGSGSVSGSVYNVYGSQTRLEGERAI